MKTGFQNMQGNLKKKMGDDYKVFKLLCEMQDKNIQDVLNEIVIEYLKKNKRMVRMIKEARK